MVSSTIRSDRVTGTDVYGPGRESIGSIDHLVIDKQSGQVRYAIMNFGGFLGIGQSEHPVPWDALDYDTSLDGYRTNITKQQLENAPDYDDRSFSDRAWAQRVADNYQTPYY